MANYDDERALRVPTRIQLKVDSLANWENSGIVLKSGEIAFTNDQQINMLVLGDGEHNVNDFEMAEGGSSALSGHIFYSGIGAGYVLPVASSTTLGGIKINENYYTMMNQQLLPLAYTFGRRTIELAEGRNLYVHGSIIADNISYQYTDSYIVGSQYIDVHAVSHDTEQVVTRTLSVAGEVTTLSPTTAIGGISYYYTTETVRIVQNASSYEITPISDLCLANVTDYEPTTGDLEYDLLSQVEGGPSEIAAAIVYQFVQSAGPQTDPDPLSSGEFAGILIHNYAEAADPEEARPVAGLVINNAGSLFYTKEYDPEVVSYDPVVVVPSNSVNGLVLKQGSNFLTTNTLEGMPLGLSALTLTHNDSTDPFATYQGNAPITVDVPSRWINTIIVNNVSYSVSNDSTHSVTLGTSLWTDELAEELQYAVTAVNALSQQMTEKLEEVQFVINGTSAVYDDASGPVIIDTVTSVTSTNSTITGTVVSGAAGNALNLTHYVPSTGGTTNPGASTVVNIEDLANPQLYILTAIQKDDNGHIVQLMGQTVDMTTVKNFSSLVTGLRTDVQDLQARVQALENNYVSLEARVRALEGN